MTETRKPVLVVWTLLVAISICSWSLGADHGLQRQTAAIAIITLAFVKAGFVASHFMDLRHAPAALRRAMSALLGSSAIAVVAFYFA